MFVKLIALVAVFYFVFSMVACSAAIVYTERVPADQILVQKVVHLDPSFSGIEVNEIKSAFSEWERVTRGRVKWSYDSWPLQGFDWMDDYSSDCSHHVLVMRSLSTDSVIINTEFNLGYGIRGMAINSHEKCKTTDLIYLVADKIKRSQELRSVTLHEIGHNVGLPHNTDWSIMNGPLIDKVTCITRTDVENFCKLWDCDPNTFISC